MVLCYRETNSSFSKFLVFTLQKYLTNYVKITVSYLLKISVYRTLMTTFSYVLTILPNVGPYRMIYLANMLYCCHQDLWNRKQKKIRKWNMKCHVYNLRWISATALRIIQYAVNISSLPNIFIFFMNELLRKKFIEFFSSSSFFFLSPYCVDRYSWWQSQSCNSWHVLRKWKFNKTSFFRLKAEIVVSLRHKFRD